MNFINRATILLFLTSRCFATSFNPEILSSEEVQIQAKTSLQSFLNDEKPYQVYSLNNKTMVTFRGSKGLDETLSCTLRGDGEIHQGIVTTYNQFKPTLMKELEAASQDKHLTYNDTNFVIGGHSRGSGFATLLSRDLITEQRISPKNISTVTFSPFGVIKGRVLEDYNRMFGNARQINLLAEEDNLASRVNSGFDLFNLLKNEKSTIFLNGGMTIKFSVDEYPDFENWFRSVPPYPHLMPGVGAIIKPFISAKQWAAHMPETYDMLAATVYSKVMTNLPTYRSSNSLNVVSLDLTSEVSDNHSSSEIPFRLDENNNKIYKFLGVMGVPQLQEDFKQAFFQDTYKTFDNNGKNKSAGVKALNRDHPGKLCNLENWKYVFNGDDDAIRVVANHQNAACKQRYKWGIEEFEPQNLQNLYSKK